MSDRELEQQNEMLQKELDRLQSLNNSQQITTAATDLVNNQPNDSNIIREQLDLSEDLIRIDYLLRSYEQQVDDNGNLVWVKPKEEDIILTEYGVSLFRRQIGWYINKSTLLTNFYEDKMIQNKMWFFGHTLNDRIMLQYEKIFRMPTVTECKDELIRIIDKRADIRIVAYEILGEKANRDEVRKEIVQEMSKTVEKEYYLIREKLMAEKYREFSILFLDILDFVHATMLRAYMGEERKSIKSRTNLMELKSIGGDNMPTSNYKSAFDMFKK